MNYRVQVLLAAMAIAVCASVSATGLATCDSGPKSGWQPIEKLEKQLTERGWTVRRVKEDGGCYEVYAIDDRGQRVEAYFHPVTLAPVPTSHQVRTSKHVAGCMTCSRWIHPKARGGARSSAVAPRDRVGCARSAQQAPKVAGSLLASTCGMFGIRE